jgi:hypothetical protein
MRIAYVCRHCHHQVGQLNQPNWSFQDANRLCGFGTLSTVEQRDTIAYNHNESVAYVHVVCDYCQEAMESNPELLLEGKLLQ